MIEGLTRVQALRLLLDVTVKGADEALCRDSEQRLRDAAARIGDAIACEERFVLGRAANDEGRAA